MLKSYKSRIYPNKQQCEQLSITLNSCRFVYNWGLERKIEAYAQVGETLSCYDLSRELTRLKKEHTWLQKADLTALQQSLQNLDGAYARFFKERKGFPKFKSKRNSKQSYRTISPGIRVENNKLTIPKIKNIKIKLSRPIEGRIKSVTISKTPTGKYYASILVDDGKELPTKDVLNKETAIGLDLGLKHFLIDSNGKKVANPKFLRKSEEKLKTKQRQLSKKKKTSNNYQKARKKLATLYEKVANRRKDFLHKLSTQIVHENQGGICIEDLNILGMLKNRKIAKAVSDVGWPEFIRQLTYKCEWYGKNLLTIGRFEPSSKTCSTCGNINQSLELKDREWTCEACLTIHDRDINAAVNIKNFAFVRDIGRNPPELTLVELNKIHAKAGDSTMKQEILSII